MQRWWNQYVSIPWPDSFAVFVSANIHGLVSMNPTDVTNQYFPCKYTLHLMARVMTPECICLSNVYEYHCAIARRRRMCVYNVEVAIQNKTYMAPGRPVVWKCIRVQTRFPFHLLKSARFLTPKHMNSGVVSNYTCEYDMYFSFFSVRMSEDD